MKTGFQYNKKNSSENTRSPENPILEVRIKNQDLGKTEGVATLLMIGDIGLSFISNMSLVSNFKLAIVKGISVTCHMTDVKISKCLWSF